MRVPISRLAGAAVVGAVVVIAACSDRSGDTIGSLLVTEPSLKKEPPPPPTLVTIVNTSPGFLTDGGGAYPATVTSDGSIEVRPECGSRALDIQGVSPFDSYARATCSVLLKILKVASAPAGTSSCLDANAPAPTRNALNFGVTSRYYFTADSPAPGPSEGFSIVLLDCTVTRTGSSAPYSYQVTAATADVYNGSTSSLMQAAVAFIVDLTFVR